MEQVQKFVETVNGSPAVSDQPFYELNRPITVTFVSPIYDGQDYYKSIAPAITLGMKSKIIRPLITRVEKLKPGSRIDKYDMKLRSDFIKESDVIVLPFVSDDIKPIIDQCKKVNPDVQVFYRMELNVFEIPESHPWYDHYVKNKVKDQIISNIRNADKVIFTNDMLLDYAYSELAKDLKGCGTELIYQPPFVNLSMYQGLKDSDVEPPEHMRIGVIANELDYDHLNSTRTILQDIKKKHGDKVEIVVFGFNGKKNANNNALRQLDFTYENPVSFRAYHQHLINLNLDLVLVRSQDREYDQTSSHVYKILDAMSLGIPVIATNMYPYNKVIKHNENGALCETKKDYVSELNIAVDMFYNMKAELINKYKELPRKAEADISQYFDCNREEVVEVIEDVFGPVLEDAETVTDKQPAPKTTQ